jgi:Asp-tRNA(Asn)/Glu-tRNA(Gln) amidotransferase A subunit family amidase
VTRLRLAGAVIMGKTVTTELAVYSPGKTRNPHNPQHTPGGSSSGSAAAVADYMVPLAIGSQTNGSVIRPASYCGVCGYKPTHGLIPRYRVLLQSHLLDHIGVFARTVEDIALLAGLLMVFDERDPDSRLQTSPRLLETVRQEPAVRPRLGFVKTPLWEQADDDAKQAFAGLAEFLGADMQEVQLPAAFEQAIACHTTILEANLALNFAAEYQRGSDQLSERLRAMIEAGQQVSALDYQRAVLQRHALAALVDELLQNYDALLTPATTGAAPAGLMATGSPVFCTTWTLCGVPAVSLPLLQDSNGMPIGVQLIGARHDDARLLRTAHWLVQRVAEA